MIRATAVRTAGTWTGTAAGTVVLDFDQRHRRRIAMTTTTGLDFLLDLERRIGCARATPWSWTTAASWRSRQRQNRSLKFAVTICAIWSASPGISATGICRPCSTATVWSSAATT
jgi:hypothetical protein